MSQSSQNVLSCTREPAINSIEVKEDKEPQGSEEHRFFSMPYIFFSVWTGRVPLAPSPTARAGEPAPKSNFFNVTPGQTRRQRPGSQRRSSSKRRHQSSSSTSSSAVTMAREKSLKGIRERQRQAKPRKKLTVLDVPEKWKEITSADSRYASKSLKIKVVCD